MNTTQSQPTFNVPSFIPTGPIKPVLTDSKLTGNRLTLSGTPNRLLLRGSRELLSLTATDRDGIWLLLSLSFEDTDVAQSKSGEKIGPV